MAKRDVGGWRGGRGCKVEGIAGDELVAAEDVARLKSEEGTTADGLVVCGLNCDDRDSRAC